MTRFGHDEGAASTPPLTLDTVPRIRYEVSRKLTEPVAHHL